MSGGLAALLDDVAALARLAAASVDDIGTAAGRASAKAAGVIVDDAAVTPRYVHGLDPRRELSVIGRIAKGSLRNKLIIILPALLLLSEFLPWLLAPLLMVGGAYLCFEGAEKLWEKIRGESHEEAPRTQQGRNAEDAVVSSAVRTDFILSAEIMVIALNEVVSEPLFARAIILAVVGVAITALVYGVVAVIVRMDDIGVALAERSSLLARRLGRGLVKAMPWVMTTLATVGVAAMLWVGGHILLVGTDELGWHGLYALVHHLEPAHEVAAWLVNTGASALLGLLVGAVIVAGWRLVGMARRDDHT